MWQDILPSSSVPWFLPGSLCHSGADLFRLIYGLGVFNMLLHHLSKTRHHKITQGSKLFESFSQNIDLK